MIRTANLPPDIVTYGVLALGCKTPDEADELIQEMYNKGLRFVILFFFFFWKRTVNPSIISNMTHSMNMQILGAMLRQGCAQHNYEYVVKIMSIVKTERIKPNEQFLQHLHNFHVNASSYKKSNVNCGSDSLNYVMSCYLTSTEALRTIGPV